jgi:hypothetical protein
VNEIEHFRYIGLTLSFIPLFLKGVDETLSRTGYFYCITFIIKKNFQRVDNRRMGLGAALSRRFFIGFPRVLKTKHLRGLVFMVEFKTKSSGLKK